jgi:hypothetical protein
MDLKTGAEKWHMDFAPGGKNLQNSGVDRGCLTPDGKTIYMPTGETVAASASGWYQIDTASHTVTKQIPFSTPGTVAGAHNTICGKDGLVHMASIASIGAHNANHDLSLKIYNPANGSSQYIGPFAQRIRPFTLNTVTVGFLKTVTEVFVNEEDYIGLGHGVVSSDAIKEVPPAGYAEPAPANLVPSHGIAVTHDNKFVWDHRAGQHLANVPLGDQIPDAVKRGRPTGLQPHNMVDPLMGGQITQLLSLPCGGRKRPFTVGMLAGIQSSHP